MASRLLFQINTRIFYSELKQYLDFYLGQTFDLYNNNPKIPQTANFSMLFPTKSFFLFIKFYIRRYFIKIIFVAGTTTALGCSGAVWKNHGDSCILISEKPPLRRVINYSDHELCGRKLSPRTAPNPLTRPQTK